MKTVSLLIIISLLTASSSWAAIDSYQRIAIPHQANLQDPADYNYNSFNSNSTHMKKFCLEKALVWDSISTAAILRLDAVTRPYIIPKLDTTPTTIDLNMLSRPDVAFIYNVTGIDNYNGNIHEPSLTIDVSAMPRSTADERLEALTHAKLALLAVTETFYAPYRATVTITGLPSQTGISRPNFTTVNATTNWPYTATSPILSSYKSELLSTNCQ